MKQKCHTTRECGIDKHDAKIAGNYQEMNRDETQMMQK